MANKFSLGYSLRVRVGDVVKMPNGIECTVMIVTTKRGPDKKEYKAVFLKPNTGWWRRLWIRMLYGLWFNGMGIDTLTLVRRQNALKVITLDRGRKTGN